MVGVGGANSKESMYIMLKAGSGFKQNDLAGNWKLHGLNNKKLSGTQGSKNWFRGNASFDANGVMTVSSFTTQNGPVTANFPSTPWAFDNTGLLEGGQGAISQDKNLVVFLVKNQDDSVALGLLVRAGGTGFSNSDLVGSWRSNWLAIGATSDMWVRSLAVIDSNGSLSSYGVNGIGESDNTSGDTIKLGPSGLVTTNTAESKLEGIMSINKKLVIYTDLKGDKFRLGILMK